MSKNQTSFEYLLLIGGVLVFVILVVAVGVNISGKTGSQATSSDVQVNTFQDWKLNCYNYGVLDRNSTVAYYSFDSDYKDYSGNKVDLTGYGNPFISSGRIKKAVKFSAVSDGVNTSSKGTSFDFYNSTLTLWFNTSTSAGYLANHYSGTNGWILGIGQAPSAAGQLGFWINNVWTDLGTSKNINDNVWHYVAITENSSGYYAWLDGIAYGKFANNANAISTSTNFIVGKGGSDTGIIGSIDDLKFYNKTLTTQDVTQDMNCTTVTS